MHRALEQPIQTFELTIQLRTYNHCISPHELPNLITAALDGDGHSCLLHAQAWTPMVKGEKYSQDNNPTCGICLDNIEKNKLCVTTPCGHLFHKNCLQTWFRKNKMLFAATCPNCRARVPVNYKFTRFAEVLSKPKLDNRGQVYYERMLVPQSGKHYNKLIYATRV